MVTVAVVCDDCREPFTAEDRARGPRRRRCDRCHRAHRRRAQLRAYLASARRLALVELRDADLVASIDSLLNRVPAE